MGRGSCVTEGHWSGQAQLPHSRDVGTPPPINQGTPSPAPFARTSAPSSHTDGEASDPTSLVPHSRPSHPPRGEAGRTVRALLQQSGHQTQGRLGAPRASEPLLAVTSALIPTKSVLPAKGRLSARIMSKAFPAELRARARRPQPVRSARRGCAACTSGARESSVPSGCTESSRGPTTGLPRRGLQHQLKWKMSGTG